MSQIIVLREWLSEVIKDETKSNWVYHEVAKLKVIYYLPPLTLSMYAIEIVKSNLLGRLHNFKGRELSDLDSVRSKFNDFFRTIDLSWLDERKPRLCFWVFTYLHAFFQTQPKDDLLDIYLNRAPSNQVECKKYLTEWLIICPLEYKDKVDLIDKIKHIWSTYIFNTESYKWISNSDDEQCRWIWNHLESKKLQQNCFRPMNTVDKYNAIIASLDAIEDGFKPHLIEKTTLPHDYGNNFELSVIPTSPYINSNSPSQNLANLLTADNDHIEFNQPQLVSSKTDSLMSFDHISVFSPVTLVGDFDKSKAISVSTKSITKEDCSIS